MSNAKPAWGDTLQHHARTLCNVKKAKACKTYLEVKLGRQLRVLQQLHDKGMPKAKAIAHLHDDHGCVEAVHGKKAATGRSIPCGLHTCEGFRT